MSLDCSKEFLAYLATKTRNHRYPLFDHHVYINGGKRVDSKSEYEAPELTKVVASMLIKSHSNYILQQSVYKMGMGKAFDEATRYKNKNQNIITNNNIYLLCILLPILGSWPRKLKTSRRTDRRTTDQARTRTRLTKHPEHKTH